MRQRRWSGLATLIVMRARVRQRRRRPAATARATTAAHLRGQRAARNRSSREELGEPRTIRDGAGKKVGMVFDIGGVGDNGSTTSANTGLTTARREHGRREPVARAQRRRLQPRRAAALARRGRLQARSSASASSSPRTWTPIAADFPDTKFAIIDDASVEQPQRHHADLRRGAGLVPGRRGRRAQDRRPARSASSAASRPS